MKEKASRGGNLRDRDHEEAGLMAESSVHQETRAGDPFVAAGERDTQDRWIQLSFAAIGDEDEEAYDEEAIRQWLTR